MDKLDDQIDQSKKLIEEVVSNSNDRIESIENNQKSFLNLYKVNNDKILDNSNYVCKDAEDQLIQCLQIESDKLRCQNTIDLFSRCIAETLKK